MSFPRSNSEVLDVSAAKPVVYLKYHRETDHFERRIEASERTSGPAFVKPRTRPMIWLL